VHQDAHRRRDRHALHERVRRGFGRRGEYHAFSVVGGPFAFETAFRFIACHPGTLVQTEVEGHARRLVRLAVITLSHVRRHEIERELRRLERMMETGAL